MVMGGLVDLLLGRADVDDDLVAIAAFLEAVEDVADHPHGGADGDGHDNDVASFDAVVKRDDFVDKFHFQGGGGADGVGFHAQYDVGVAATLEVEAQRSADQSESDDSQGHEGLLLRMDSMRHFA